MVRSPLSWQKKLSLLWATLLDKRTSFYAKAIVGLAVLYGVSPLDILPDVLPLLGWTDDVVVILAAFITFLKLTKQVRQSLADTY